MNQQQYDQIKHAAFEDEINKIAGPVSEVAGTALWFPGVSAIGGLAGAAKGGYKDKKEYTEAMGRGASNVLIPGAGTYRLARRAMTPDKIKKDYDKSKSHEQKKEASMNQQQYDQIAQSAFEDEMSKIAKEEMDSSGNYTPGHLKSYYATLKGTFKHPIKTIGSALAGEIVGGVGGAGVGAAAGLGVAGVSKLMKKTPNFKGKALIGALAGGYGGAMIGGLEGWRKGMKNIGVKANPYIAPPFTRATLTPAAQKDLNIHPKKK